MWLVLRKTDFSRTGEEAVWNALVAWCSKKRGANDGSIVEVEIQVSKIRVLETELEKEVTPCLAK